MSGTSGSNVIQFRDNSDAAKMEIIQDENIPDPNKSKNRIPRRAELATLRSIRIQKQQLASTIANQVLQARAAHARIQARYEDLLQEMEALQSEITISRNHLRMLEKQQQILQEEENELAGLLHPIRRYPEDVLRIIFIYAAKSDDNDSDDKKKYSFRTATNISHVCKFWRTIALEISPLWKYLYISTTNEIGDAKAYIERTKNRTRSSPVWMDFLKIEARTTEYTKKFIRALGLEQLGEIEQFYFYLSSSKDILRVSEAIFGTSLSSTKFVWVDAQSKGDDDSESSPWDCSWLLRQPKLDSLQLNTLNTVLMTGSDTFPSLTELSFFNLRMPTLALQLPRLPSLKVLTITGDFQMESLAQDVTMAMLSDLMVERVDGFPWHRITAPRLNDVSTDEEEPMIVPFLCRHPSICALKINSYLTEEGFKSLALHLNNIEALDVAGDLNGLVKRAGPDVPFPPFPRLKELSMQPEDGFSFSLQEVEDFVKIRRLLSQEGGIGDISLLSLWTIRAKPEFLEHAPWRTSSLLSNCEQTFTKVEVGEPWSGLSLRWSD